MDTEDIYYEDDGFVNIDSVDVTQEDAWAVIR